MCLWVLSFRNKSFITKLMALCYLTRTNLNMILSERANERNYKEFQPMELQTGKSKDKSWKYLVHRQKWKDLNFISAFQPSFLSYESNIKFPKRFGLNNSSFLWYQVFSSLSWLNSVSAQYWLGFQDQSLLQAMECWDHQTF